MKKLFLFAALLAVQTGLIAQDIKSENLQDFNKVYLSGKLNVVLEKSDRNALEIKLSNSDIKKISWSIKEGKLSVKLKPTSQKDSFGEVTIYYKNISAIEAIDAAVRFKEKVETGLFSATVSSGGMLSAEIEASDVSITADGNSSAAVTGKANYLSIKSTKKSKVDARAFEARSATVLARYGGEVFVWPKEKLDATAGSGSSIYYKGNPEILKMDEKTLGTVDQFSL